MTDRLVAIFDEAASAIVPDRDAEIQRRVMAATTAEGRVRSDNLAGPIPVGYHGPVADESVATASNDLSTASNQRDMNADLAREILAGVTVTDQSGEPSAGVRTVVFPEGALTYDAAARRMIVAFPDPPPPEAPARDLLTNGDVAAPGLIFGATAGGDVRVIWLEGA